MQPVVYDGTFAGFMTAVFEVYEYRFHQTSIVSTAKANHSLFATTHTVQTNDTKAKRISVALAKYCGKGIVHDLYIAFLSEIKGMEDILYRFIKYVFTAKNDISRNYSNPDVLTVSQTIKKVRREKHRMEAFVRFQLTKDQLYYSIVEPDFNVLPLISIHFEKRYADQRWLIYDSKRKYGIYYDLNSVQIVEMKFEESFRDSASVAAMLDENEMLYQQLWMLYFDSINIAARKNMKLHIRHMPKRYWKYLPEKRG